MELTEKRIRECVRYCRDESSPGPYWIYDVKGVRGMYLYRSRGNVQLRQVCGAADNARPHADPILASGPLTSPAETYATVCSAIESRGFTITD